MKQVYKIDENGYMIFGSELIIEENENIPIGYIDKPLPINEQGYQLPFYKPKWNGNEWIEGLTEEEISNIKNQPQPKTEEEKLKERVNALEDALLFLMDMGGM